MSGEQREFHTMETVWRLVDGQLIFNPIESELPIFDPISNSTHDAAKKGHIAFLLTQKYQKFRSQQAKLHQSRIEIPTKDQLGRISFCIKKENPVDPDSSFSRNLKYIEGNQMGFFL